MATDSDQTAGGVDSAVQSAVQTSKTPAEGPHAQVRARAREGNPQSAESQPSGGADDAPGSVTWSDYLAGLRDAWQPPDIWSQPRPGLKERWAYAARGEWTGDGALRRAGQVYAVTVAFPAAALLLLADWVFERPSRLTAAGLLLALCSQFPPLSWL